MNQTATTTSSSSSSSAAAVADSANAAATSKTAANTVDPPVAVAASNNKMGTAAPATTSVKTTSVKLLIKASNQQFDDQIIESDMLWTVKRLKSHLAMVYPSKPPIEEQKLIYSGQLLNDALLLKDVIRSYKDVYTHNHIFHLVYTPKNTPTSTSFMQKAKTTNATTIGNNMNSNSDGLRQRNVAGTSGANATQMPMQYYYQYQSQQQQLNYAQPHFAECPQYVSSTNPLNAVPFGMVGQLNMQAMATQQVALYNWMQQVYSQYMEQCIRLSNNSAAGVSNISTTPIAMPPLVVSALPVNPFLQQLPCVASPLAGTAGVAATATTDPVIPFPSTLLAAQAQLSRASNTQTNLVNEQQPAQNQQQMQREQQAVAAPRFPNIVQDEEEEEEGRNRDWLDNFFSISRLAIFLTILYFNSSPMRCLAVVLIAGGIYLYHIGVLRIRHERNNNNINRNNNEADQIRRGVRQVQQAARAAEQQHENLGAADEAGERAMAADNNAAPVGGAASTADGVENINTNNDNQTSVISVVRTFVVTFFTSLLPEVPAEAPTL